MNPRLSQPVLKVMPMFCLPFLHFYFHLTHYLLFLLSPLQSGGESQDFFSSQSALQKQWERHCDPSPCFIWPRKAVALPQHKSGSPLLSTTRARAGWKKRWPTPAVFVQYLTVCSIGTIVGCQQPQSKLSSALFPQPPSHHQSNTGCIFSVYVKNK